MIDLLLIHPGNNNSIYQELGQTISGIEPPTFALLIATYVRRHGFSVELIDMNTCDFDAAGLVNKIEELNPKLIAIYVYGLQPSASTQLMPTVIDLCTTIKSVNNKRKIFLSGTHPCALPQQTLSETYADYICYDEGFRTIVDLLRVLDSNSKIKDIKSLGYKEFSQVLFSDRGKLLTEEELSHFVKQPAWDLIDLKKYRCHNWHAFEAPDKRSPYASMYTTLGCPFKCFHCCINTPFGDMLKGPRPYRLWDSNVIIDQIDTLVQEYNVRNIKFVDEMFLLNKKHVLSICDSLIEREDYDLNIWAYARVDKTDEFYLEKLRRAGFRWLCLGIESGNEKVRHADNKKFSNESIYTVVKRIHDFDIHIIANYIFGLPDDDLKSMQDTFDLAVELNCEFDNYYCAMAYPGSPLYYYAVSQKWELPLTWSGYSQHSYDSFPLRTKYLINAEVLKFRDEAFVKRFSDEKYKNMLLDKFGQPAVDSVNEMLRYKLKRKLLNN